MADSNCSASEVGEDAFLSDWELSCFEDWDKSFVMEERRIQAETEKSSYRLWSSFQNSASTISQLYKDGLQSDGVSLWIPFQSAAGQVTNLYKDSQELIRKSFELGNQMGHHRRNKEIISWLKRRRRTLPREEIVAFICEKPLPTTRHKSLGRVASTRRPVELTSPRFRVSSPARDYCSDNDFQPFRDALQLQGLSGAMMNSSLQLRTVPSAPNDRLTSFLVDEFGTRKRIRSGDGGSSESPCQKRSKVCGMETEDL